MWSVSQEYLLLPPFLIMSCFDFYRYIIFSMYLNIIYFKYVTKIYVLKSYTQFRMEGLLVTLERQSHLSKD
jgi:hypothetical protein